MKSTNLIRASLLTLSLLFVSAISQAEEQSTDVPPETVSKFMRAKLIHSQKLLEALALEDFAEMAKHSQDLKLLSHESNWNVLQTEQFVLHSQDFRRRADALTDAAKKRNLDGASLAFVELTLNCVQCHKHVREARGKVDAPKPARK